MTDLKIERAHLAKADSDIAAGEGRIAAQLRLIERLRLDSHETSAAEELLLTLRQTLQAWRDHRDEIAQIVARLEQTSSR